MRLYERWLLPGLLDLAMRNRALDRFRRQTVASAHGKVLEIGAGSGLNLALYGAAVERVVAIDPSPGLLHRAGGRIADARVPVSLVRASAERLPFAASAFDTIVMTWTLCSIPDPAAALAEMRRVLRPGGVLAFVEHGLAPQPGIARWQHRLTPYWKPLAGGCHLDRGIDALIRDAGFRLDALDTGYIRGPKPWTFMYQGRATA
ncbi:MAG TPA: class I SAM-dependent methyltransferase [Stellaceae bacterium]|nr:class I SAM-dependent methyltransferase [Stellaceae bacterium]